MIINGIEADLLNQQISFNVEWSSKTLIARDKLCKQCFRCLQLSSDESIDSRQLDVDDDDRMSTNDGSLEHGDNVDSPTEERSFMQQKAAEELNAVFQLLKMEQIRDK